jgi:transposase
VLLARLLAHIDFLEERIAHLQEEIEHALAPFTTATELLQTLPGVGAVVAAALVAELGTDPARFPSAKHLASWAGGCPGNKQSAGKRLSGKTTKGNVWLRGMLTEAAGAVARSPGTSLHAQDHRIARRRGKYKAARAVAHRLLVIAYCLLRDQAPYRDLGPTYLDERATARTERSHVRRLEQLGSTVTLSPAA